MKTQIIIQKKQRSFSDLEWQISKILLAIVLLSTCRPAYSVNNPSRDGRWTVEALLSEVLSANAEIKISEKKLSEAAERENGSQGKFFPKLSVSSSYAKQDSSDSNAYQGVNTGSGFQNGDGITTRAVIQQNIYNGFQDHQRIAQRKLEHKKAQYDVRNSILSQKESALALIYKILVVQSDIENLKAKLQVEKDGEKEIQKRILSRATKSTELLSLQATMVTTESDLSSRQTDLESLWQELSAVAGTELRQTTIVSPTFSLETWSHQLESQAFPDVEATALEYEAAQKSLGVVKGQMQPSLDFSYSYYLSRPDSNRASQWDMQVTLTIPFPWDREKVSAVGEQEAIVAEKQIALVKSINNRQGGLKTLIQSYEMDLRRLVTLNKNVKTYERLAIEMKRENLNGHISMTEYLQELKNLLQARQSRDHLRFQLYEKLHRLNEYKIEIQRKSL